MIAQTAESMIIELLDYQFSPIIFLDIDGVLNTAETYRMVDSEPKRVLQSEKFPGDVIDKALLLNLEGLRYKLNQHFGRPPLILGISSWFTRHEHVLKFNSLVSPTIFMTGKMPFTGGGIQRGDELLKIIEGADLRRYVILDDSGENMYRKNKPKLWNHLIQVDGRIGLTAMNCLNAFDLLTEKE